MVGGAAGQDIRPVLKSGWGNPSGVRQGMTPFRVGECPTTVVVDSGNIRVSSEQPPRHTAIPGADRRGDPQGLLRTPPTFL